MSAPMTPERLAEIRKAAEAIEHRHVGPGRCSCGYDAYAERGIMLDYHALIVNHFDRVKRNPVRPANTEHVKELLAEVARLTHLLGSHADGHRCTCTMTDPGIYHGNNARPPEWEHDPWCPTHPDMDVILTEVDRLRAQVASVVQDLGDAWDAGNCIGLDGWVGPGRGTEPDEYACRERDRYVARKICDGHPVTEYGTTRCPVEHVAAEIDSAGDCSACGEQVQP